MPAKSEKQRTPIGAEFQRKARGHEERGRMGDKELETYERREKASKNKS